MVWVPKDADEEILSSGEFQLAPTDCRHLAARLFRSPDLQKSGYLICNNPWEKSWGPRFANIANLVAVVVAQQGISGLLVAVNEKPIASRKPDGIEWDTDPEMPALTEEFASLAPRRGVAAALAAFASLFSLHAGAAGRYRELKELVVGWKPVPLVPTSSDAPHTG